ncbi:hypothetical protein COP1_010694 [Malus domestica]
MCLYHNSAFSQHCILRSQDPKPTYSQLHNTFQSSRTQQYLPLKEVPLQRAKSIISMGTFKNLGSLPTSLNSDSPCSKGVNAFPGPPIGKR